MSEDNANNLKRSPLHSRHEAAGARLVDFAGWEMPVQYEGVLKEHEAVRHAAGLFDISHMGEVLVNGRDTASWLDGLLTNRVGRLSPGQGHYTLMTNDNAGVIDDLILYRVSDTDFLLVLNAARLERDLGWLYEHLPSGSDVALVNASDNMFGMALQGPRSEEIFLTLFPEETEMIPRNTVKVLHWQGTAFYVCGTGYTGEPGCEFFGPLERAGALWDELMKIGEPAGIRPCGLASRDVLRLEMCMPLNGQDLTEETTPLEAGLRSFISFKKTTDYPGKEILHRQFEEGVSRKLCALEMQGRTPPPRAHYPILDERGNTVGEVTSGNVSPSLGKGVAMGYLPIALANPGQNVKVQMRRKEFPAQVVKKPFLKKSK